MYQSCRSGRIIASQYHEYHDKWLTLRLRDLDKKVIRPMTILTYRIMINEMINNAAERLSFQKGETRTLK